MRSVVGGQMVAMRPFPNPAWSQASRIAADQWGNATLSQLFACGCSRAAIRTAVRTGQLHRVHQGVYALGRPATTPHERAMAAVLAGGPGALLSHRWALWLYDLGRLPDTPPDVTVSRSRTTRPGLTFHRSRAAEPDGSYGIPATTPARTLADCAPSLTERQLRRAVNQAQVKRLTNAEALLAHPATRALVSAHGATRSLLEDLLLGLARDHGLPAPEVNELVHGVEVDFHYPGLVIEADGYNFHFTRIQFEDDHERRLYLEARGERVVAVTYAQVTTHRARTATRLSRIVSATSTAPPRARPARRRGRRSQGAPAPASPGRAA